MQDRFTSASDVSKRPVIVSDFNGTLEWMGMVNEPLVSVLRQAVSAGFRVIIATEGHYTSENMRDFLKDSLGADIDKVEFKRKENLIMALRQNSEEPPIVPRMVFENNPEITYLNVYYAHAHVLPSADIAIAGKLVPYDDIPRRLGIVDQATPAPGTTFAPR